MKVQLLTQSDTAALILTIGASATALQAQIHQAAVSTLSHAQEHGDYRGCLDLLNALPNGQRVKALNAWYAHFSTKKLSFKVNKDTKQWEGDIRKDRTAEDFLIEEAMATSYADFTQEKTPTSLTVVAMLKALEAKANNTEKNEDGSEKVTGEARCAAAKIVAFAREAGLDPRVPVRAAA